jgi:small subunit ribosomal protein S5
MREIKKREKAKDEFLSAVLDLKRVARMTAGGRKFRFRAVVAVGDQKGKTGVGIAKGADVSESVEKATRAAKKNLIRIPIVNDTIPHKTYAKFGAAEILLKPQSKGRGLVAGGTVRIICNLAGIKNISSKVLGRTTNKLSNAMATIEALKKIKNPCLPAGKNKKSKIIF